MQCFHYMLIDSLIHPNDLSADPELWEKLARPNEKRKKWKGGKARKVESPAEATTTTGSNDGSQWKIANVLPSRFKGMPAIMGDFRRQYEICLITRILKPL